MVEAILEKCLFGRVVKITNVLSCGIISINGSDSYCNSVDIEATLHGEKAAAFASQCDDTLFQPMSALCGIFVPKNHD